jgi:hypothetical protein
MRAIVGGLLIVLLLCGVANAQFIGQLRGGIFAHGSGDGNLFSSTRLDDANVEFQFKPLVDAGPLGSLHPDVGITANFGGEESFGYLGLQYHLPVLLTPFFVEAGIDGALGSRLLGQQLPSASNPMALAQTSHEFGCALLLHEQVSAGMDFVVASVMLTAEHYAPLSACSPDHSSTNVGARLGVSF